MNLLEAMKNRHSVRSYTDKKIEGDVKEQLLSYIKKFYTTVEGFTYVLCTLQSCVSSFL